MSRKYNFGINIFLGDHGGTFDFQYLFSFTVDFDFPFFYLLLSYFFLFDYLILFNFIFLSVPMTEGFVSPPGENNQSDIAQNLFTVAGDIAEQAPE